MHPGAQVPALQEENVGAQHVVPSITGWYKGTACRAPTESNNQQPKTNNDQWTPYRIELVAFSQMVHSL